VQACLTCVQLKDRAYLSMIHRKLTSIFEASPCSLCGETDLRLLVFAGGSKVYEMIAAQEPWVQINREIQKYDVTCANCFQIMLAEKVGRWGIPSPDSIS
jgi:hypothetical protein